VAVAVTRGLRFRRVVVTVCGGAVFFDVLPNPAVEAVGPGAVRVVVAGLVDAVASYLTLDRDGGQMFGKSHSTRPNPKERCNRREREQARAGYSLGRSSGTGLNVLVSTTTPALWPSTTAKPPLSTSSDPPET